MLSSDRSLLSGHPALIGELALNRRGGIQRLFYVAMASFVVLVCFVGFAPSFYLKSYLNPDRELSRVQRMDYPFSCPDCLDCARISRTSSTIGLVCGRPSGRYGNDGGGGHGRGDAANTAVSPACGGLGAQYILHRGFCNPGQRGHLLQKEVRMAQTVDVVGNPHPGRRANSANIAHR